MRILAGIITTVVVACEFVAAIAMAFRGIDRSVAYAPTARGTICSDRFLLLVYWCCRGFHSCTYYVKI